MTRLTHDDVVIGVSLSITHDDGAVGVMIAESLSLIAASDEVDATDDDTDSLAVTLVDCDDVTLSHFTHDDVVIGVTASLTHDDSDVGVMITE